MKEAQILRVALAVGPGDHYPPHHGYGVHADKEHKRPPHVAKDDEGDEINYDWVHPVEGGVFYETENSSQRRSQVFFEPIPEPGEYVVGVKVWDDLHGEEFATAEIIVQVRDRND